VAEARHCLGLAQQPLFRVSTFYLVVEYLESDRSIQSGVESRINRSHTTASDSVDNPVSTELHPFGQRRYRYRLLAAEEISGFFGVVIGPCFFVVAHGNV
jgi:hypothetical protein